MAAATVSPDMWPSHKRRLLARAASCLVLNRWVTHPVHGRLSEDEAVTLTIINLAESNGYIEMVGPLGRNKKTNQLFVGNLNGSRDYWAWQINDKYAPASAIADPVEAVKYAISLVRTPKRFGHWAAWNDRAKHADDWNIFELITTEAVAALAFPAIYRDAQSRNPPAKFMETPK